MRKVRCIIKKPGEWAQVREIENTAKAFQGIIGGYLESVYLGENIHMYMDEEGKLKGLRPNLLISSGGDIDIICGTVIIVRADLEGEEVDLSLSDIVAAKNFCAAKAIENYC